MRFKQQAAGVTGSSPDELLHYFICSNLGVLTLDFSTKYKNSPSGQVRYASQAEGEETVMKHALHRSSFNTDEHHYCSTDNVMLKEESTVIILLNAYNSYYYVL